jgi:hypothetical protein
MQIHTLITHCAIALSLSLLSAASWATDKQAAPAASSAQSKSTSAVAKNKHALDSLAKDQKATSAKPTMKSETGIQGSGTKSPPKPRKPEVPSVTPQ